MGRCNKACEPITRRDDRPTGQVRSTSVAHMPHIVYDRTASRPGKPLRPGDVTGSRPQGMDSKEFREKGEPLTVTSSVNEHCTQLAATADRLKSSR